MDTKVLELRDKATFIPIIAIKTTFANEGQRYLLRRAGYDHTGSCVILFRANGGEAHYDPYEWTGRTFPAAHHWIVEHFDELSDGDVVDVEFILGETSVVKQSERTEVWS
jgi:hypothetical protein